MKKLKKLSLYRECAYSQRDTSKPSIEGNKFMLSNQLASEVLSYLESGKVLYDFVSPTTDPYDENDCIKNVLISDGVYVWDGILINWVKKYKIRLPEAFLNHIKASSNKSRLISDLDSVYLINQLNLGVDEIYL